MISSMSRLKSVLDNVSCCNLNVRFLDRTVPNRNNSYTIMNIAKLRH